MPYLYGMKKIVIIFLLGICLTIISLPVEADSESITISLGTEDPDRTDPDPKGLRTPVAPNICTIDYGNHCITSTIPYEIIAYELWDEEGHAPLVSYKSDYEFVEFISGLSGNYQLRLVTNQRVYVGYLDL